MQYNWNSQTPNSFAWNLFNIAKVHELLNRSRIFEIQYLSHTSITLYRTVCIGLVFMFCVGWMGAYIRVGGIQMQYITLFKLPRLNAYKHIVLTLPRAHYTQLHAILVGLGMTVDHTCNNYSLCICIHKWSNGLSKLFTLDRCCGFCINNKEYTLSLLKISRLEQYGSLWISAVMLKCEFNQSECFDAKQITFDFSSVKNNLKLCVWFTAIERFEHNVCYRMVYTFNIFIRSQYTDIVFYGEIIHKSLGAYSWHTIVIVYSGQYSGKMGLSDFTHGNTENWTRN